MEKIDLDEEAAKLGDLQDGRELELEDFADEEVGEATDPYRKPRVAAQLAMGLLALFALTVVIPALPWLWCSSPDPEMLSYAKDIASMELGLLGAAVAFYYSQKQSEN